MAGTQKTSQFTAATVANPTDEVPLLQSGVLKRVQVKTLVGNPDVGWLATGESWTYSSWDATRRIGVVNVPSDATTKYTAGNRVRISQTTGGTKYAIITYVTSTTLTLHFPSGITLNNEAITSPVYSPLPTPVGFPSNAANWILETTSVTSQAQLSPTAGVWYNPGSNSLALGPGVWDLGYKGSLECLKAGYGTSDALATLSTANNSESDSDFTLWEFIGITGGTSSNHVFPMTSRKTISITANATYYLNVSCTIASQSQLQWRGSNSKSSIRAVSSYL